MCVFIFFNTAAFIRSFQSLLILQNSCRIIKKWPLPLPKLYYNTISLLFTQAWLLCTFLQHCINHSVTIRVCDIVCHSLPGTISPVWLTSHHWCPAALIQCHCPEVIYWMSGLTQESAVTYCTPRFFHEWLPVSQLECFPMSDALVVNCPYHSASFLHMGSDIFSFFFFKVKHPFFREQNNPWFYIPACWSCNSYFNDIWDNNTSSFVSVNYCFWFITS